MKLALYSFVGRRNGFDRHHRRLRGRRRRENDEPDGTRLHYPFPPSFQMWASSHSCSSASRFSPATLAISYLGADRPRGRADGVLSMLPAGRGRMKLSALTAARCDDFGLPGWMIGSSLPVGPHVLESLLMIEYPMGVAPCWALRSVARCVWPARGHRHRVWRGRRAGAEGFQICHRLFERQPHGLYPARPDDHERHRAERRGAANVFRTASSPASLSRRWWGGWFMTAPIRETSTNWKR